MPKAIPDQPIRTLDDLPETGLVLWRDFLSSAEDRRLIPFTHQTWRRMARCGDAPPPKKYFNRMAEHAELVRAVALGQDWRAVEVNG